MFFTSGSSAPTQQGKPVLVAANSTIPRLNRFTLDPLHSQYSKSMLVDAAVFMKAGRSECVHITRELRVCVLE
jgi:hypothetical protein